VDTDVRILMTMLKGTREGDNYIRALCPFHDDHHPSLFVYHKRGRYRCRACGARGTIDSLYHFLGGSGELSGSYTQGKKITAFDPKEWIEYVDGAYAALHKYYREYGVYLRRRGVGRIVDSCKIGYVDGWYVIPIYDMNSKLQGLVRRASSDNTDLRYWNPAGQPPLLYVPSWGLALQSTQVVVTFGIFDALFLASLGIASATPTSGKNSIYARDLWMFEKPIYIIPDEGEEDTALRLAGQLGWRGKLLRLSYPEGTKDPNDFFMEDKVPNLLDQLANYGVEPKGDWKF
jgi:DNA primase